MTAHLGPLVLEGAGDVLCGDHSPGRGYFLGDRPPGRPPASDNRLPCADPLSWSEKHPRLQRPTARAEAFRFPCVDNASAGTMPATWRGRKALRTGTFPCLRRPMAEVVRLPKIPRDPIWTENKARLISRYLYGFVLVARHGTYIDGFAAPQRPAANACRSRHPRLGFRVEAFAQTVG